MEPNRPSRCDMKKFRDLTFYHPTPPGHISLVSANLDPVCLELPSVCFAEYLFLPCPNRPPLSKEENETGLSSASLLPPSTTRTTRCWTSPIQSSSGRTDVSSSARTCTVDRPTQRISSTVPNTWQVASPRQQPHTTHRPHCCSLRILWQRDRGPKVVVSKICCCSPWY